MFKDAKFVFRFVSDLLATPTLIATYRLSLKEALVRGELQPKLDGLDVLTQPYGRKRAITKFSEDLVPVAIEGIAEMDGMETTWAIVLNPLCWGTDVVKSVLGAFCRCF